MHRARKHAYLISVFAMFQFSTKSESVNDNCYVHMDAIVFSDSFWLKDSKGLLLYALSSFMPRLALS